LPNDITEPDAAENMNKFYADIAIPADSFVRVVAFAINQPEKMDINEILYRPTKQEY
jgi:NADP-dependent 3-hydroxy acid dehydrogenase YdfG